MNKLERKITVPLYKELLDSSAEGVFVYTKDNCPKCKMTKRIMNTKGIEFTELWVDINKDDDILASLRMAGYNSFPVVVVKSKEDKVKSWCDFRPNNINSINSKDE